MKWKKGMKIRVKVSEVLAFEKTQVAINISIGSRRCHLTETVVVRIANYIFCFNE